MFNASFSCYLHQLLRPIYLFLPSSDTRILGAMCLSHNFVTTRNVTSTVPSGLMICTPIDEALVQRTSVLSALMELEAGQHAVSQLPEGINCREEFFLWAYNDPNGRQVHALSWAALGSIIKVFSFLLGGPGCVTVPCQLSWCIAFNMGTLCATRIHHKRPKKSALAILHLKLALLAFELTVALINVTRTSPSSFPI